MNNKKITFQDLSTPLKTIIVISWVVGIVISIEIMKGIIAGFLA